MVSKGRIGPLGPSTTTIDANETPGPHPRDPRMATASALDLAQRLARLMDEKKAEDVVILDVSARHSLIDCFVIATGRSAKHAKLLGDEALACVKERGLAPWHVEGSPDWVCGDFGDVVLHVFTPEARDYYGLEHLWADARKVPVAPSPRGDAALV